MFGFLIALGAGFATPYIEKPLAEPVVKLLEGKVNVAPSELRLVAFIIAMIIAAIVCAALNAGGMIALILGGAIGYFGLRIVDAVKALSSTEKTE